MKKLSAHKNISQMFSKWLLICVAIAFAATMAFIYILQTKISENDTDRLLRLNIQDVKQDIIDASNANLLKLAHEIADDIEDMGGKVESLRLSWLLHKYDVAEMNVINQQGIITASTYPDFLNYNMANGAQSGEFLVLLQDTQEYVQSYQPVSYDASISRKYAGVKLNTGGFVQVGYDAEAFQKDIASQVIGATRNRHVGEGGCLIICDDDWSIVSDRNGYEGKNLAETGIWIDRETMPKNERFIATAYGIPSYCMYAESEGYCVIAVLPKSEAVLSRNVSVCVTVVMELFVFTALFIIVYILLKRQIVDNVRKMNHSLSEISGGNLDVTVNVRSNVEFSSLSDDINTTVDALKHHIAAAAARIDQELEYARSIQHAALPSVFPPYPQRTDFSIYAQMDAAKEVGGDFYDFYLLSKDTLGFLIADVSGKGIPAAMFMMKAKTLIQGLAESGTDTAEIFTQANKKLCENNDTMMFVTAWMGILDLKTGILTYVNAGHNAPLLKRKGGGYEYLRMEPGFVLAALDGITYESNQLTLTPGDSFFLYTDGVTEATNTNEELFGEERLRNALNRQKNIDPESTLKQIKCDVEQFVGDAPQFDDIAMLGLAYYGPGNGGNA